jgi:spermidine synthase
VTLRRRHDPVLDTEVYEVKLGDEFLMSSRFTDGEIALARLGLAAAPNDDLDVVVGGLGLGYTTLAALEQPRVRSVHTIEAVPAVIGWHERRLLADTAGIADDPRSTLRHADFFDLVASGRGFDPDDPGRRFDAVLLDVDHSPRHHLHDSHAAFYTPEGLQRLRRQLRPGGVFALWSDDPPDDAFLETLRATFPTCQAHVVSFANPYTGGTATNTIYTAR